MKVTKTSHHSGHNTSTVYIPTMEKKKNLKFDWYSFITLMEKTLLVVIAFLTAYAVLVEIISVVSIRAVKLTDLLLLFIYAEVLGMVAAFYKYRKIPITVPIFIAITALCRLIILQGKGINTIDLLYESSAILLLAVSALVIRWNLVNLIRPSSATDGKDRD
ncbi:phosphate-starvation-inducible PsiE family protein [Paracoccaceae bacterium]|nr:phosphate-starvation-inducible PsiE family protein [Paracoccaceae bacterium]